MAPSGRSNKISATPVTILAHLIAITVTILVFVWLLHFEGGLSFKSSYNIKIFNLHPLLMIVGLVLIGGEGAAIMAYKTVIGTSRDLKRMHLILHILALLLGVIGTFAVFKFKHSEYGSEDFVTLHTWLGIITISLYGLQFAYGLFALFFPNVSNRRGTKLFPGHEFVGMAIFLLAICAAETGLVNNSMTLEWSWGTERLIVNFIGLLIFLFWVCVSLSRILQRDSLMVSLIDDIGSAIDIGSVIADLESNGIALELQD